MTSYIKPFFILVTIILVGCQQPDKTPNEEKDTPLKPSRPYAELKVPAKVDMGTFTNAELKKTTTLLVENTGTDTLYISAALPDCDCTEILYLDSVIAPGHNGQLTTSLDLTTYPSDTIRKEIGILSNDYKERVKRVMLIGLRQ